MTHILLPLVLLLLLAWIIDILIRSARAEASRSQALSQSRPITSLQAAQYVRKFGRNSNSFMTLYEGFEYFTSSHPEIEGAIPFIDMPHAWVGGAEPLCHPEHWATLLDEFAHAAASAEKSAVLIPISTAVAQSALTQNYNSILIGGEPTFNLEIYPRTGKTWIDTVPTAKGLDSKGAKVSEFHPSSCTQERKKELESITQEWLASRKMDPLGFLNKVEPWTLAEHKRYFSLELSGRTFAFLAAIPIWPRKGWYLIDLMRRNDSPAGCTELLTLQAMRLLRESGAEEVTFGVSPLALLNQADTLPLAHAQEHPMLYPFLRFLYEKAGKLYGFKSLFQYKQKFDPTRNEPAFLIYRNLNQSTRLSLPIVVSVFQAFSRHGIISATWSGVKRSVRQFKLSEVIKNQLESSIVVRSVPRTWRSLLYRCKLTLTLIVTNLVIYLVSTPSSGLLYKDIETNWGYSWGNFVQSPFQALILSPFLHWNLLHLNTNLIFMVLFTGGLEYVSGTTITGLCYLVAMIFSNPLTSAVLLPLGLSYPAEIDVGASLGIFGCAGALSLFLKQRIPLLGGLFLGTFIQAFGSHHWNGLNHWAALLLGFLTGFALLKR